MEIFTTILYSPRISLSLSLRRDQTRMNVTLIIRFNIAPVLRIGGVRDGFVSFTGALRAEERVGSWTKISRFTFIKNLFVPPLIIYVIAFKGVSLPERTYL